MLIKLSQANEAIPSKWTKGPGYFIGEFPVQHADGLAQLEAALLLGVMLIVCTILLACYYDWKFKLSFIVSYCVGVVMSSIVKFRTDCLVNTYVGLQLLSATYMWSYICCIQFHSSMSRRDLTTCQGTTTAAQQCIPGSMSHSQPALQMFYAHCNTNLSKSHLHVIWKFWS